MKKETQSLLVASFGNIYEYFIQKVFTFSGVLVTDLFFPKDETFLGVYGVYIAIASSSFLAPVGAFFIAWVGDKLGRRAALSYAYCLGIASPLCISLLPTYEEGGLVTSIGIIVARVIQGMSMGGAFGGSVVLVSENSSPKSVAINMGFIMSLGFWGSLLGTFLCFLTFHESEFSELWRLPYILGVVMGGILIMLRGKIHDADIWKEAKKIKGAPLLEAIRKEPHNIISVFLFGMGSLVPFYIWLSWGNGVLRKAAEISSSEILYRTSLIMLLSALIVMFSPLFLRKIPLKTIIKACIGGFILLLPFFYKTLVSIDATSVFICQLLSAVFTALLAVPIFLFTRNFFPAEYAYSAFSVPFLTGQALFMAPAPLLCEYLFKLTGRPESSLIILVCSLIMNYVAVTCGKPYTESQSEIMTKNA